VYILVIIIAIQNIKLLHFSATAAVVFCSNCSFHSKTAAINSRHQLLSSFHSRYIFHEIGRSPWQTHSFVKFQDSPWISTNFVLHVFIKIVYLLVIRNDIVVYLSAHSWYYQSSSTHIHVPVCHMRSSFIFIFVFLIVCWCQNAWQKIWKRYMQVFYSYW